ncbi:S9 family peptidase [Neiella sp. HB171785]|uniref:S9 family peptidase n=1 Tax=Neiella litorisoli TaxID=2771431 RepID=A0A8J6QJH0_9GAMM|nr:S9 family peptidase [Neiella litorisoli]MBD1390218.1 S9 family peptidase [Neiella litorisoli]
MKYQLLALALAAGANSVYADTQGLTVDTIASLNKIHSVTVSPDGKHMVYGVKSPAVDDQKKSNYLFIKSLNKPNEARQLTSGSGEHNVVWAPDGSGLLFLTSRSGSSQIWRLPLNGGEAVQVSDLPLDVEGFKLSADGETLVLSMSVDINCDTLQCSADKIAAHQAQKATGRVYDQLMVRHWDTWLPPFKRHLYTASINGKLIDDAQPVMLGWNTDVPARPFSGMEEVAITHDGKAVIFAAKAPGPDQPWHTNFDLYYSKIGSGKITNLTEQNKAWDSHPTLSPDGKTLAYLAMKKPGFEADRFGIILRDLKTGKSKEIAADWDRSTGSLIFSDDGRKLYVTAQDLGQRSIFEIDINSSEVTRLFNDGYAGDLNLAGNQLVFSRHALNAPKDIYALDLSSRQTTALTEVNKSRLADTQFGQFEQFEFAGWNNETVYGYWVKPVGYQAGNKYPVAFLIHGGPQGSFGNMFHFRWNAQLWAAQGYGVVMIDFHGSTGYGQQFTNSISRDWGGKPLEDLQKGFAAVAKQQPWLDQNNACALGASYGGYMINWIAGNWNDGFKCLINHAGLYDLPGFYATTEELWFPEHEWGGPQWQGADDYVKFNPANYVDNWQTPMLVIHGEKDFRVPYDQGIAAFTALQRRGIPSRLIMYPDENHWILNMDNLKQWYAEVFRWMDHWTAK